MRCTKCHYLSFEPEPRCRNCGHDLSLEEPAFSLADATLDGFGETAQTATAVLAPPKKKAVAAVAAASRISTAELPLFVRTMPGGSDGSDFLTDDTDEPEELEPLVRVPARPRTPIAVRRTTPDAARLRAKYGMDPEPDLLSNIQSDPLDAVDLRQEEHTFQDLPLVTSPTMPWPVEPTPERLPAGWQQTVGAGTRLVAAAIDAVFLGAIYAVVLYLTLRISGLSILQAGLLPVLPLAALFVLFAVGYLLMFTLAGGQTVGKMAMNIRVVGTSAEAVINDRVTVSQAVVRALAALPSVLAFGVGFVPALVGAGLAVHDRIAHTRVVHL